MLERSQQLIAWDGTDETFWKAVKAIQTSTDIESDHAVLCEVLELAHMYEALRD